MKKRLAKPTINPQPASTRLLFNATGREADQSKRLAETIKSVTDSIASKASKTSHLRIVLSMKSKASNWTLAKSRTKALTDCKPIKSPKKIMQANKASFFFWVKNIFNK